MLRMSITLQPKTRSRYLRLAAAVLLLITFAVIGQNPFQIAFCNRILPRMSRDFAISMAKHLAGYILLKIIDIYSNQNTISKYRPSQSVFL